jgi:hypothetical protein
MTGAPGRVCVRCSADYHGGDQTPLSEAGYCMRCRLLVQTTCLRCGTPCAGAFDGLRKCSACRAAPLGVQQYEDKQAAAWAALQRVTRVLITGSRTWTNDSVIWAELSVYRMVQPTLVHGDARGADRIAAGIWRTWGLPVEAHPADWDSHGRAAGMIRNRHMVTLGADVCLAFIRDQSPGATHCADLAEQAGIPTRRYRCGSRP